MAEWEGDWLDPDQRSRVRCDDFWYEVLETTSEVSALLDHGDEDWVELTGAPDSRPIWLRASHVDYVEAVSRRDDLEAEQFNRFVQLLLERGGAHCAARARRHVGSGGSRRSRLRAGSAALWL